MFPLYSPTPLRDFIWVAEYADGTYLSEFDFNTQMKNDFYSIKKQDLIKFGLVGHGYHFLYDVFGGSFYLPQGKFDLTYLYHDSVIPLTNNTSIYNDIVTFKVAESSFSPLGFHQASNSKITEYVFGYKQKIKFNDININIQSLFKIPFGTPMKLNIRLVSDKDMDGKLQIINNGSLLESNHLPLVKCVSEEIDWEIR